MVYINLLKEEVENNGKLNLTIHGNSMLPLIKCGDILTVIKCHQYKIGDIVAYHSNEIKDYNIIVHRVIFVRKTYVLTKGDNNDFIDPIKVKIENIIGKIIT